MFGILLCLPYYFFGQTITFNKQFSSDTIYNINQNFLGKCSSAELNGSIVLHSDTSVVRIFLTDTKGNKWMMAEAYQLISADTIITLLRKAEETKYLAYNTDPHYLEFYITDATVTVNTIVFSNKANLNYLALARNNKMNVENAKVTRMNLNLEDKSLLWRAVLTEQVLINYRIRASIVGSYKGNIDGYWYYGGGYFCDYSTYDSFVNQTIIYRANDTLPNVQTRSFDWRAAHGANLPTSPYFDGNPDYTVTWISGGILDTIHEYGNGWLTSAKRQKYWEESCPKGCYVFAFMGPVEALINLYFNQHLDYDLSEQHVMDCFPEAGDCLPNNDGGYYSILAQQVESHNHRLVDENSYPWVSDFYGECFDTVAVSCKIHGLHSHSATKNENTVKRNLLTYGPLSGCPRSGHACTLVGYKLLQAGDTININNGWHYEVPYHHPDTLIVPEGNPLIGRTIWIFKENDGAGFGCNGYVYIVSQPRSIPGYPYVAEAYAYTAPIIDSLNLSLTPEFHDYDGDGYYFWGLGPKPASCPGPAQEDCDDNDPFRLYYDENLFCTYDCDSIQEMVTNTPIYISNDTTIYGGILTRPIVVEDGALLTMRGEFQCTENVYILANIGANIYAVGAAFNAICGDYWRGFVGFANTDPSLLGGITGRSLIILRNCLVEDALYAMAGDATAILRAYNTTFQNNVTDIAIKPWYLSSYYAQVNQNSTSEFNNCNFITDTYFHNDSCLENVSLSYCKDIEFNNCSFIDEGVSGRSFYDQNRTAINTYKTGFTVINSNFDNLGKAINCINSMYLPVTINENYFFETHYSIYLSQTHGAEILMNYIKFNPLTCDETDAEILPYGIYLDQCHDYHVEADTIRMTKSLIAMYNSYSDYISGIVVNDSYNSNEQIYRNTVIGMAVGTQAIGLNRDDDEEYGLKILCNDYSRNITDIFVTNNLTNPYPPGSPIGIAQVQGTLTEPAGNFFTKVSDFNTSSVPVWSNIINDVQSFNVNYYHHDPATNSRVYPDSVYNVIRFASLVIYSDSTCLDHTESEGGDTIIILPELRALSTQIEEVSETLESLTDGGNTQLTVAEIVMANDNTAWQTYLSLMDKSPYLSDESLKEVAKKDDGLTLPMVRDILVANPQSAKNAEISGLLDERIDELPGYMLEQIAAGMTEISPKEYLELQKSHLTKEYSRKSSALLRQYLREPDLYNAADVENLLHINPDAVSAIKLAEYYASQSNYSEATSVLNNINTTNTMLQNEIGNLSGLFELMQTIESDTLLIDEERLSSLSNYESDGGIAGAYARGLIQHFSQSDYKEPVFLPEIMLTRKGNAEKISIRENSYLKVYPNPAKDFISIEYKLTEEMTNSILKIVSVNGQILKYQKLLNDRDIIIFEIKDLTPGNYFVYLENNGKKIESVIITVVK